jgi:hypothetical protein
MRTTILAYVIAILGLALIVAGAWDIYVLRLITSSNFVDCITGRSPGFAPLRRPT